jgi:hypothetical protein
MSSISKWSAVVLIAVFLGSTAVVVGAQERIELDDTAILGSRELPKVTYIVPWKRSDVGRLEAVAAGESFGDGMGALDRDLFRKELEYFSMLQGAGRQLQQ